MKIALVGATGFVGTAILSELLDRGHQVIAIVRNIDKIKRDDEKLVKKAIDVFQNDQLTEAFKGADVIISAYNGGWTNPNIYNDIINGSFSIQKAVKNSGVSRFIYIGGAGTLMMDGDYMVNSPEFPEAYKIPAGAVKDYFVALKEERDLDWVFFSPAIEMNPGITTGRTGKYRVGKSNPVFDEGGRSVLSVQDLAVVIADELETNLHHQEQFTAGY